MIDGMLRGIIGVDVTKDANSIEKRIKFELYFEKF